MKEFGQLKRVNLRALWAGEAADFTPWLAANIPALGEALGMDLELEGQEASVGDFSLDLLVKDLRSGRMVVIENQLTATDHNHLGKLLTYAAGFNAATVVWIAESIREEHRQALEWLNQRTDTETEFFAIMVEVLQIDGSRPAYNFRPVVFPNEWQKSKSRTASAVSSERGEAYRTYFQELVDELREKHRFTNQRVGLAQSWVGFSSGIGWILYGTSFAQNGRVRAELSIQHRNRDTNKRLFDWLRDDREAIEREFGEELVWERLDEKQSSRIAVYRPGSINSDEVTLRSIRSWTIEELLKLKRVFGPRLKQHRSLPSAPMQPT